MMKPPLLDGIKKNAGLTSEAIGSAMWGLTGLPLLAGVGGLLSKPRDEEAMRKQEERGLSNILVPGLALYRLGRRLRSNPMAQHAGEKIKSKIESAIDEV